MRPLLALALGLLGALVLTFTAAGCEEDLIGGTPGFSFDAAATPYSPAVPLSDASPADAASPDTTFTSTPLAITRESAATFAFTSSAPGATFACRLDDQAAVPCTSPHAVTVTEGIHTFTVTAGADPTPATFTWTVDQTIPKTTITRSPAAIDNSALVTFEFSASEEVTFLCTLDNRAAAPCTSPLVIADLVDGAHTFTVIATDRAGNLETPAVTHGWSVDTTTPDTTITAGPTGVVNTTTATFTFTSNVIGATFACSNDDGAFAACTSPLTRSGLADGSRKLRVRAVSAAGSQDITPAERVWTVDTAAPTVTITGGTSGPTADSTPTFTFTVVGATATTCSIDGAAFVDCASPFTTGVLADGSHTIAVRAVDAATNASTTPARAFSVDTTAPTVAITGGPAGPTTNTTPTFAFTTVGATTVQCRVDADAYAACTSPFTTRVVASGAHTFDVQATDAVGNTATDSEPFTVTTVFLAVTLTPVPSPTSDATPDVVFTVTGATAVACQVDTGAFVACTSPFTPAALGEGVHTISVRGTDAANVSIVRTTTFMVDTQGPTVTITGGPEGPTTLGQPTFTFTVGADAVAAECSFDGTTFATCGGSYFPPNALPEGAGTFTLRAIDAVNNVRTATRSFIVDTIGPDVQIIGGVSSARYGQTVGFTITAEAGATVRCRWFYAANGTSTPFVPCAPPNVVMTAPTGITGPWLFYATANDAAGNLRTAGRNVNITP